MSLFFLWSFKFIHLVLAHTRSLSCHFFVLLLERESVGLQLCRWAADEEQECLKRFDLKTSNIHSNVPWRTEFVLQMFSLYVPLKHSFYFAPFKRAARADGVWFYRTLELDEASGPDEKQLFSFCTLDSWRSLQKSWCFSETSDSCVSDRMRISGVLLISFVTLCSAQKHKAECDHRNEGKLSSSHSRVQIASHCCFNLRPK